MVGRGGKGKEMEGRGSISAVWLTGEKRRQRISYSHILPGLPFPIRPNWAEMERKVEWEKLFCSNGKQVMRFIIPVKNFHLFKIVESAFIFYLKLHNFKQVGIFY